MLCPICKKQFDESPDVDATCDGAKSYSPFCSERCKLIDLGRWLGGKYQIPVVDDDEAHDGDADAAPR